MDYQTALRHVLALADYERMAGLAASLPKYDLARMEHLLHRLGEPQRCAPVVHVAGTKGKGSVAAMVTAILEASGYRAGLYTSPHLHTMRERIRIGSRPVSEAQFASLVGSLWPQVEAVNTQTSYGQVTTFELLTAMAFAHFRRQGVDVQVLEVGLGGRLDATNVARGTVCVITPVSLDHTAILGDTIEDIAREKASIIKGGAYVVSAPQSEPAARVIAEISAQRGAQLHVVEWDTQWRRLGHDLSGQSFAVSTPLCDYVLWTPLLGLHQIENAAVAVAVAEGLNQRSLAIDSQAIDTGLRRVRWSGRLEVLSTRPLVVADGAHNDHSVSRLVQAVQNDLSHQRLLLVFGCSADKNLEAMVSLLAPVVHHAIVTRSRHPRAAPPSRLAEAFRSRGVPLTQVDDVAQAMDAALQQAHPEDMVLATGSLFVAAEAIQAQRGILGEQYPEMQPAAVVSQPSPQR